MSLVSFRTDLDELEIDYNFPGEQYFEFLEQKYLKKYQEQNKCAVCLENFD